MKPAFRWVLLDSWKLSLALRGVVAQILSNLVIESGLQWFKAFVLQDLVLYLSSSTKSTFTFLLGMKKLAYCIIGSSLCWKWLDKQCTWSRVVEALWPAYKSWVSRGIPVADFGRPWKPSQPGFQRLLPRKQDPDALYACTFITYPTTTWCGVIFTAEEEVLFMYQRLSMQVCFSYQQRRLSSSFQRRIFQGVYRAEVLQGLWSIRSYPAWVLSCVGEAWIQIAHTTSTAIRRHTTAVQNSSSHHHLYLIEFPTCKPPHLY
jgi:hypothetical protein